MARPRKLPPLEVHGNVWLSIGNESLGGKGRIGLLRAIRDTGSITQAAKAIGMSYKAAWDAVDTMNNLADAPLVERAAGGRGGGGTRLTERGDEIVQRFEQIDAVHQRFVAQLSDESAALKRDLTLLRTLNMKTSARNQFAGTVARVTKGAVNDEIQLEIAEGLTLTAIITRTSTETLGLKRGVPAFAMVKASSVLIATGEGRISARNQFAGRVSRVTRGAVNGEVVVELPAGPMVAATVTNGSIDALKLKVGAAASVVFKASSVILGVPG